MTTNVPQVILTLTPSGDLAVELPGFMATRRKIILREKDAGQSLKRILRAQLDNKAEIGLDGAPTIAQLKHWERHGVWPDSHCRFCIAEGRAKPDHQRVKRYEVLMKRSDGVEVRRLKEGMSGKTATATVASTAEECGL